MDQDFAIVNSVDKKGYMDVSVRLSNNDEWVSERWRFIFTKNGYCAYLLKDSDSMYVRAMDGDPRNGSASGTFFYRMTGADTMEKIRVYNGYVGETRKNFIPGLYDDWINVNEWRINN